jgi:magnesium-transporting ATPase (P-type)
MDTMGALALATEAPTRKLLDRHPYAATASIITPRMWRFIALNSALQLFIVLALVQVGPSLLGVNRDFLLSTGKWLKAGRTTIMDPFSPMFKELDPVVQKDNILRLKDDVELYMSTFIFNYFVFAQIFNEFNARELGDDALGALRGIAANPCVRPRALVPRARAALLTPSSPIRSMFIAIILISMGLQAIFVEVGGEFFKTTSLTGVHWGYTVGLAALQLVIGVLLRFVPVPTRASDFASLYTTWFAAKQAKLRESIKRDGSDTSLIIRSP